MQSWMFSSFSIIFNPCLSLSHVTSRYRFSVQDRAKRLKLLNFMADKAELLYKPLVKEETSLLTDFINDDEGVVIIAGGPCRFIATLQQFWDLRVLRRGGYGLASVRLCVRSCWTAYARTVLISYFSKELNAF